jgi:hypothetical protein
MIYIKEKMILMYGITIELVAQWDAFNSYSRIFDFGSGWKSNNFILGNNDTKS